MADKGGPRLGNQRLDGDLPSNCCNVLSRINISPPQKSVLNSKVSIRKTGCQSETQSNRRGGPFWPLSFFGINRNSKFLHFYNERFPDPTDLDLVPCVMCVCECDRDHFASAFAGRARCCAAQSTVISRSPQAQSIPN